MREVMTAQPVTVRTGTKMIDAVAIMAERKISELPVVDTEGRPVGLIDVTDVVGMFPEIEELGSERRAKPEVRGLRERRAA